MRIGWKDQEIFNYQELSDYTGFKYGTLKNLVCQREIPHYKPTPRTVYFKREDVDKWLLQNRVSSNEELEYKAINWGK